MPQDVVLTQQRVRNFQNILKDTRGEDPLTSRQKFRVEVWDPRRQYNRALTNKPMHVISIEATFLPLLPAEDLPRKKHETCAVVGNAGTMLHSGLGTYIDAHEAVIRINYAPTRKFELDVGACSCLMHDTQHAPPCGRMQCMTRYVHVPLAACRVSCSTQRVHHAGATLLHSSSYPSSPIAPDPSYAISSPILLPRRSSTLSPRHRHQDDVRPVQQGKLRQAGRRRLPVAQQHAAAHGGALCCGAQERLPPAGVRVVRAG